MKIQTNKIYDLEDRTFLFAKSVFNYCRNLPRSLGNPEYCRQVIRSSSSVGANYIEANEALGKKDFYMRIRICRKEAKETAYWLKLIVEVNDFDYREAGLVLYNESIELKKIFASMGPK